MLHGSLLSQLPTEIVQIPWKVFFVIKIGLKCRILKLYPVITVTTFKIVGDYVSDNPDQLNLSSWIQRFDFAQLNCCESHQANPFIIHP